jgi:hypothetical protein
MPADEHMEALLPRMDRLSAVKLFSGNGDGDVAHCIATYVFEAGARQRVGRFMGLIGRWRAGPI